MSKSEKLHCRWSGCPFSNWNFERMYDHESQEHVECVCHRYFLATTIYRHQHRCSVFRTAEVETKKLTDSVCAGCGRDIQEGQHYLLVPALVLQTRMSSNQDPVHSASETMVHNIVLCTPSCLGDFANSHELIMDMFGSVFESTSIPRERMYEIYVESSQTWLTLDEAARIMLDMANGFGQRVLELDGVTRPLQGFDRAEIRRRAQAIIDDE